MRRAPERRRVRLWKFFRWVLEGNLPRPAPRQAARAGVRFSFAGRSAVLRQGRCEPALLRVAPKMQLPCRRLRRPRRVLRHGPAASCSAAMASRVSVSGALGNASPASRPPRSPRQSRLRSRTLLGPVVPRERSEGFTRLPHCRVQMSLTAVLCRPGASVSIRPCRLKCGDMAHPCRRVHLPMRSAILGIAGRVAPRRRQPQATAAAPVPDFHRPSPPDNVAAGPQIDGVRLHPAPRRHQKRMFSSLAAAGRNADLAPRHYRIPAFGWHAAAAPRRSATTAG